ncbi:MAG: NAD(P)-binding domain-containing protein [Pseudobdellovibrionaceae bacterium]
MTKVAIIGAGPAGLVSAKSCLEAGLTPVVFEASNRIGGLWSAGKEVGAWNGMKTNLSRWSCMFSDFPWPEGSADFPRQHEVATYLDSYADTFGLRDSLRLTTRVVAARPENGAWHVSSVDADGQERSEVFARVIVASGVFARPHKPFIFGEDHFKGRISHSAEFNPATIDHDGLPVIIGGSFSAYEMAAEFAKVTKRPPLHVVRHPAWILPRYMANAQGEQIPSDLVLYSRGKAAASKDLLPLEKNTLRLKFFESAFGNPGDIHPALWVDANPKLPAYVAISDDYKDLVKAGNIHVVRDHVSQFEDGHFLRLGNGKKRATDHVVLATGFKSNLDFLDVDVLKKLSYDDDDQFMPLLLADATWPAETDGLGFVGMYRGPYFGVMELQARWVAGVFSGDIKSPSADELAKGVKEAEALRQLKHRPQFPYGDYVALADGLARKVGCFPDVPQDDPLAGMVHDKTFLPCHYRLQGPHANRTVAEQVLNTIPYVKP